jgi:hypothetical protein
MRDVFLSYARDDREQAAALAGALESRGVSVWWDRQIPPGRTFDEVIEEALTGARCVLVLWSEHSIQSRWVRAEASEADERGVLVPVLIQPVEPPLGFRNIQAADLAAWRGDLDDPELQKLFATVSAMVGSAGASSVRPMRTSAARRIPVAFRGVAIALISLVAGAGLMFLLLRSGASDSNERSGASDATPSTGPGGSAGRESRERASSSAAAAGRAGDREAGADSGRIDLLAAANGGHLVRAPHENWMEPIDGSEAWEYLTGDEAVYAFKGEQPATFDAFAMLITETRDWNIKRFELLAGSASPVGPFQSLGTFETQNVRLFPSAWQQFTFPPARARYLKVKVLGVHRPTGTTQVEQWQLLGRF